MTFSGFYGVVQGYSFGRLIARRVPKNAIRVRYKRAKECLE